MEPNVCTKCRKTNPQRFANCEFPCHSYKEYMAKVVARQVRLQSKTSAEAIKHRPASED